jgi:hypothetical protein
MNKMNSKAKQTLKSGDNSTNLQAQNMTVNQGMSYSDVKAIALDVFNANFLALSKEALKTANERAEEITNNFIQRLKTEKPDLLDRVKDPGFQYALFEAQKNYAKNGDKDMSAVLVDILVDRIEHQQRDLKQIVLDESIQVIPKLTISQLDTLTVIFLLRYSQNNSVVNFDRLKEYLETNIRPFIENLSKENSLYQHLEFTGCGNIKITSTSIESILKNSYGGLFSQGFSEDDFIKEIGDFQKYGGITTKCLNDEKLLQLNSINLGVLEAESQKRNFEKEAIEKLKTLFKNNLLPDPRVKDKTIEISSGFMNNLFDVWQNSPMRSMTLTTVGIAIAQANFRRKTGITLDLSIWIK